MRSQSDNGALPTPYSSRPGWRRSNGYDPSAEVESVRPAGEYIRLLLGLLRRHVWLVLLVVVATVGVTAWRVLPGGDIYEATAVLRIADGRRALTEGIDGGGRVASIGGVDPLQTHVEILRSRRVLGEAVDATGFRLQPRGAPWLVPALSAVKVAPSAPVDSILVAFGPDSLTARAGQDRVVAAYGDSVYIAGVRFAFLERPAVPTGVLDVISRVAAISRLRANLRVLPRGSTDIVDVRYTAANPGVAQTVVNGVVAAFEKIDAEMAQQQARRRREFLAVQARQNDSLLAEAQLRLSAFENRVRGESEEERTEGRQAAVVGLEVRLRDLEGQRQTYRRLLSEVGGGAGGDREGRMGALLSAVGTSSSPVIGHLSQQLVGYQTARDTLVTGGRAATNPDVVQVDRLISSTQDQLVTALGSHLEALDTQISTLREIRAGTSAEIRSSTIPPAAEAEVLQLQQEVEAIQKMADLVRVEYQRARIAEAVEAGEVAVVDLATWPGGPVPDGKGRKLAFSLLLGLLLGTGAAYVRESMDTAIHEPAQLESEARLPTLATIPRLPVTDDERRRLVLSLSADERPVAGAMEPYRMLSVSLAHASTVGDLRRLVVTSALPGEGKSTTAANLAIANVQGGHNVVLVDCDVNRPVVHTLFGIARSPGLSEVLEGQASLVSAVSATRIDGLSVLPAGRFATERSGVLNRPLLIRLLDVLGEEFDRVILDAPPLLLAANALVLATVADGVVMVIRSGRTDRTAVRQALEQLSVVGAPVVGTVLNDPDGQLSRYSSYYEYGRYDAPPTG